MTNNKTKRKMTRKQKLKIAGCVFLAVILICVIAFFVIWNSKPLDNQKGKDFDPTKESGFDSEMIVSNENQVNFLIVGEKEKLTDVIMVASVNVQNNSVEILQIPRDCYVSDDYKTGKINAAYTQYGSSDLKNIARTQKMIYDQFKINIDHYLVFNLESFRNTVDAMGGITIDIQETLTYGPDETLNPGKQLLNGEQSEWFIRERNTRSKEGDIGRIKAQRQFLAASVQKVKDLGIKDIVGKVIPSVLSDIDNFSSDMTVKEMANYAKMFINIKQDNIRIHMVPGESVKAYKGYDVYGIHAQSTADLLNEYFRPYSPKVDVKELGIKNIADNEKYYYYENTPNKFNDLLNGEKPGKKNNSSSTNK